MLDTFSFGWVSKQSNCTVGGNDTGLAGFISIESRTRACRIAGTSIGIALVVATADTAMIIGI